MQSKFPNSSDQVSFITKLNSIKMNLNVVDDLFEGLFKKDPQEVKIEEFKDNADNSHEETQTVKEIIEAHGLTFEAHEVKTEDGYILQMHRVYSPDFDPEVTKPAIMMQHGILSSSESFMLHRSKPAAIMFAKEGYDVWLGNNRGTLYSKTHEKFDPTNTEEKSKYFDYSFFELGKYDVPAQIDFIL